MNKVDVKAMVSKQRAWFQRGATLNPGVRLAALRRLKRAIQTHQGEIAAALKADLGKGTTESYLSEIGLVLSELSYMLRHTRTFSRPQRVDTPLAHFPARSYQLPSPCGVVLVMSPWNYPFLLTVDPLVDAIAAGNTVVVKPSAYAPHTGRVLQQLLQSCFDPQYVAVVTGGREENRYLLQERFDHILFTGSQSVGREVMAHAAQHLTPVTLELGGKSPCIVEQTADLTLAARRIVFGKYLNCGQTCVAPDYVLCDAQVKGRLIAALKEQIVCQFGPNPLLNPDYGKIVNARHFERLLKLLEPDKLVCGGRFCRERLQIEPTIMDNITWSSRAMQEEIFGPILPILTYHNLDTALDELAQQPHPLALYLFTRNRSLAKNVMAQCSFGGGCVNDVVIHLATSRMGFGGVGESGMGSYHGQAGFRTFSHYKSIVERGVWLDPPMRYQPYRPAARLLARWLLR